MANNPHFSGGQPPPNHLSASLDPSHAFAPPVSAQFGPMMGSAQQSQQFMPVASSTYQSVGRSSTMINPGLPYAHPHPQLPFPQSILQLPPRPCQPVLGPPPPTTVVIANTPPNALVPSGPSIPPPGMHPLTSSMPGLAGPRMPLSSTYAFAPSSYGQPPGFNAAPIYPAVPQIHPLSFPPEEQLGMSLEKHKTPVIAPQKSYEQQLATANSSQVEMSQDQTCVQMLGDTKPTELTPLEDTKSDWKEHISANGRRYYYNRRTQLSSWEKPLELMTPIERADATTDWKEFSSPDGRKYYYNKVTKQSKWTIPEELKMARESVSTVNELQESIKNTSEASLTSNDSFSAECQITNRPSVSPTVDAVDNLNSLKAAEQCYSLDPESKTEMEPSVFTSGMDHVFSNVSNCLTSGVQCVTEKSPSNDKEAAGKGVVMGEKVNHVPGGHSVSQESLTYVDKQEGKTAFKALLESANVGSDWTWEQAMRAIINDQRYGALKTLAERKHAFNEFLSQRKKQEIEEKRLKHKKAREEFRQLLEESTELTSSTRWSKAIAAFEKDVRFKAVERERDRRDLFDEYVKELGEKEHAKAQEERKQNVMAYRQFLESCDFIKASTQWRKVQDRLEADERCSCLEKIDRLNIFQDYLHDLEKEEEEQKKIQKEELRKIERKNRDDFRKLIEADVTSGILTAKSHWRDYYSKVKDSSIYLAVASNTSGSTPKDLFEDVVDELQKQYHNDKVRVKDAIKLKKFALTTISTLDQLKDAIAEDILTTPSSTVNLKIIFDELLEKAKEKEGKEMKKRKHLSDEFMSLLGSIKEITASSKWEDCKILFEGSREFSSVGDESLCRDIFEEYLTEIKEQAKQSERRRKDDKLLKGKDRDERERRKAKQKRDKERGHDKETEPLRSEHADLADDIDVTEHDGKNRLGGNARQKHRKGPENAIDDFINEGDRSRTPHKHQSGQKKSKRHTPSSDSDDESKHKRHKRDYRNGDDEDLEDGEFGADRESW